MCKAKQLIMYRFAYVNESVVVFLLSPNPFREMGALRQTMKPQRPRNSPRPGLEIAKRKDSSCQTCHGLRDREKNGDEENVAKTARV